MSMPPSLRHGHFVVKYKRIPHDDRYYIIYWMNQEIVRYKRHHVKSFGPAVFWFLGCPDFWLKSTRQQWETFKERVEKYDEYLDKHPF